MFALSSFVDPYYGVIGYTFISIIRPEQLTWGVSSINNVFAVAIISLVISSILRNEKLLVAVKQPFFICFIIFTISLYCSTFTSGYTIFGETRGNFYYLNQLPQILCFCICLYAVLSRVDSDQLQKYVIITLSFITFMGIWGIDQNSRGNIGAEGLFGYDRCAVTSVFVMYLPIAYFFVNNQKLSLKLFGILSLLVCFTLIILTESRAGFLGLSVVIALLFWYSRSKALFLRWALLLLLLGFMITPEGYFSRFDTMQTQDVTGNEITDYSSASRLLMWKVALKMIADRPLVGVGNLNFSKANKDYSTAFEGTVDKQLYNTTFGFNGEQGLSHTHNTFLNILVEGGLISAVPFFLLFILPLRKGLKLINRYRDKEDDQMELVTFINIGIAGFLVTGFFGNLILVDYFYWNLTLSYFFSQRIEAKLNIATKLYYQGV
jgi:O-antigen ligase